MKNNNTDSPNSSSLVLPEKVQRENIWRLSIAQALAGANSVVVYATGAIVGDMLAPTPILATLPISIFVVGMAACIFPIGAIARRHGRRAAFDRKSVVSGKNVSVRVDLGGRRITKKKES